MKAQSPKGYESTDASVGGVFGAIGLLALVGVCIHFALTWMFRHLEKKPTATDSWTEGTPTATPQMRPGVPRLQLSPSTDLETFRSREEMELNSYGWVNRTAGIVHIPITQAMALVVEKKMLSTSFSNAVGPSSLQLQQERPRYNQPEIERKP